MAKKAQAKPPKEPKPDAAANMAAFQAALRDRAAVVRQYAAKQPIQFTGKRNKAVEEAFLDGLRGGWSVASSAEAVGISSRTARDWRQRSEETVQADGTFKDDFCVRWADAMEDGVNKLEDEAMRRAAHGVEKPVYQGGVLVGTVTEYSDTLMQIMLKGKAPQRYNVDRVEHTGKDGGKILQCVEVEFVEHKGKK